MITVIYSRARRTLRTRKDRRSAQASSEVFNNLQLYLLSYLTIVPYSLFISTTRVSTLEALGPTPKSGPVFPRWTGALTKISKW